MTGLYRLALHLLPAQLRRKHGAAMAVLFARDLELARTRGRLHAVAAGAAGIWDVVGRSGYELFRMNDIQLGDPYMSLPTTRQLLFRHALSFTVAFVGLTAVMLFAFGSRQVPSLIASGAPAWTIARFLLLAVPFTAAMTIPMAVLLSVLHEFTRLGKDGTLNTARRERDGVRRLVVPVLVAAAGVTALAFVVTAEIVPRTNARLLVARSGGTATVGDRTMTIAELREAALNAGSGTEPAVLARAASYEVEVQKKLALPAACLVLAMAGMALAFRIPRGGTALVIGASLVCFGVYYGLLITGETLADQLVVSPFVGMWGANAVVLVVALLAAWPRRGAMSPHEQGPIAVRR